LQYNVSSSVIVFAGPSLPVRSYGSITIPTPDGIVVILIGGAGSSKSLYEPKCSSNSCMWLPMEQKLSAHRYFSVAINVPDCSVRGPKLIF
jgi:hypothetical protein